MENNKKGSLSASREFKAPKERLYQAWTSAEDLKQWWKPQGAQLSSVENELKEHGTVRYHFDDAPAGRAKTISGEYYEVAEGEKLVYSWNWQQGDEATAGEGKFKLTVLFEEAGDGSRLSVTQEQTDDNEPLIPTGQGWEQSLEALASYLEKDSAGTEATGAGQEDDIAGYNEAPEQQKVGE
ncbi:SRPBCC domain-containing protein [Arcticibacter sp. MXS-1]|uniref:SRPBCC family protein n=1 Tax=Arcticibacter sp. MXS-1 TaxID=3341726 RepID=UPI0035A84B5F